MDENEKNENTRIERIKKHIKDNKKVYITATITGGVCLIAGAAATYVYGVKRNGILTQQVIDSWKFQWKPVTNTNYTTKTITKYGNDAGRPGKEVFDTLTKKWYKSISLASRGTGLSQTLISNQLSGRANDIHGPRFVGTYGEAMPYL